MRVLKESETYQRGCWLCADLHKVRGGRRVNHCPYEECPYHELDSVKTYGEYMRKTKSSRLARALAELTKE